MWVAIFICPNYVLVIMVQQTELYVWDVGDGAAIYVKTPNDRHVVIDCVASDGFSPAEYLKNSLRVERINYLIISHPHKDHRNDLEGMVTLGIDVLRLNKSITRDIMIESNNDLKDDKEGLDRYFKLSNSYTKDVEPEESPQNKDWGEGCTFKCFNNKYSESGEVDGSTVNNLSVVTFIEFGTDVVLYGGDMEEDGWKEILGKDGFKELLKKTTIYIASHHGHKSGYYADMFEYFKPKLTIISGNKRDGDDDATGKYGEKTEGVNVDGKDKKILTTHEDGHIHITLYDDGDLKVKLNDPPRT